MLLYNTLSGKKEEFRNEGKRINIFVCGPTVYDYQHIGNGKTQLVFDLFVRYLRSEGFKVFYLQNITDIDDKIIKRAAENGAGPQKLADDFYQIYLEDVGALGIKSVTKFAPATKYIKQIVSQIKSLINKGYAYKTSDGYYFNIAKFPEYGKLSHRTTEQAEDGVSRIDESGEKMNRGDFCLWKFWTRDEKEPYWNTALGKGRPGWHIEDTAITEKFFGPQYDIHGGGLDLKFPHHEAELTQQEAASGLKPFVRYWMHSGLLYINGTKMSKSLGNFITIREFLKKCPAEIFRYIVFMHHYRQPVNYTEDLQKQAETSFYGIKEFVAKLAFVKAKNKNKPFAPDSETAALIKEFDHEYSAGLQDDFNTPNALAAVFSLTNKVQKKMWSLTSEDASALIKNVTRKFEVLGFDLKSPKNPAAIVKIAKLREISRVNKQFTKSDELRKEIEGLGYKVEDTPLGQFILKIS